MNLKKGFTLLEILLVVGIIAILAGIVILAINPNKQLATVRNAQRLSDLKQINNAMVQYYIDHNYYPASSTFSFLTEICNTGTIPSTSTSVDGTSCGTLANLSDLVPVYVVAIPVDPTATSTVGFIPTAYAAPRGTGYKIMKDANNKIALSAPIAELNQSITLGPVLIVLPSITYNGSPLYISPIDNSGLAAWGCFGTVAGASSTENGSANTIIAASCTGPAICNNLDYGGYSDWYLPAQNQLIAMYNNKDSVNKGDYTAQWANYQNNLYWSSTEAASSPETWSVYVGFFTSPATGYGVKFAVDKYIRCVRS